MPKAEVREARLHDARHTAATVLALLEAAPHIALDFMGWSNPSMMLRYKHMTDGMKQNIAIRLDDLLLSNKEKRPSEEPS